MRQTCGLSCDPEKIGMKAIRFDRRIFRVRAYVTALDENLLAQHDPYGIPGDRHLVVCATRSIIRAGLPTLDRLHNRSFIGGRENQFVANSKCSGFNTAGDDSARVEFVNILHAKPQW